MSQRNTSNETSAQPDELATAVLRRHATVPAALSPWAQAHLSSTTHGPAATGLVRRAVTGTRNLPVSLSSLAVRPTRFAAAVLEHVASTISAKYEIQRASAPAEGNQAADLPLAQTVASVTEDVVEEAEASPEGGAPLTFSEMLARVRGQAQPEPESETRPEETAARPRAPNATFAEMLALIGRKPGVTPSEAVPGAPATGLGARASSAPAPVQRTAAQRTGAPVRRRAEVEEMAPAPARTPTAPGAGVRPIATPPEAEAHEEDETSEEPWSPPSLAPPAAPLPSATVQRIVEAPPRRPHIEEVEPAEPAVAPEPPVEAGPSRPPIQAEAEGDRAEKAAPFQPLPAPGPLKPALRRAAFTGPSPAAELEAGEHGVDEATPAAEPRKAATAAAPISGPADLPATTVQRDASAEPAPFPQPAEKPGESPPVDQIAAASPLAAPSQSALEPASELRLAATPSPWPRAERPSLPADQAVSLHEATEAAQPAGPAALPLDQIPGGEQSAAVQRETAGREAIDFGGPADETPAVPTPSFEPLPGVERPSAVQRQATEEAASPGEAPEITSTAPTPIPEPLPPAERPVAAERQTVPVAPSLGAHPETVPPTPIPSAESAPPEERPVVVQRQAIAETVAPEPHREIRPLAPGRAAGPLPPEELPTDVQRRATAEAARPGAALESMSAVPAQTLEPLPPEERPTAVQRQAAGEDLAAGQPPGGEGTQPAEAVPPRRSEPPLVKPPSMGQRKAEIQPATEPVITPPALPETTASEPAAPALAQREAAPFPRAEPPGEAEQPRAEPLMTAPATSEALAGAEAAITGHAVEPPPVQRAAAAQTAAPGVVPRPKTETPLEPPAEPSADRAALAGPEAQAHLPMSTPPAGGLVSASLVPAIGQVAAEVISRKEAAPLSATPASTIAQRLAATGRPPAVSGEPTHGEAESGAPAPTEGAGPIAPESPVTGSPASPAPWAPVLPQARRGEAAARPPHADARQEIGTPALPLAPRPVVVLVNRRSTGDEQAQRAVEAEAAEPEPRARAEAAPESVPAIVQRALTGATSTEEEPGAAASSAAGAAVETAKAAPAASEDLDQLARDLLPVIKRLLAVERERRPRRW